MLFFQITSAFRLYKNDKGLTRLLNNMMYIDLSVSKLNPRCLIKFPSYILYFYILLNLT